MMNIYIHTYIMNMYMIYESINKSNEYIISKIVYNK